MLRKFSIVFLSLLLMAMTVTGCSKTQEKVGSQASSKPQPIKLGVLPIEDNLPFYVAESDKLFQKAGIDVTLIPFASAQERDTALQAGQIDGEVADLVAVGLLKKGGTDVKVASIGLGATPQEGRFALLAASGSKLRSAADLKNVPIGVSQNTIIEFVTDMMMRDSGIDPADVKKISVPKIPVRMQMLAGGQIDAAVLPDPVATLAEKQGSRVILDDTRGTKNLTQTVIVFTQQSIKNNREVVKKVVEVYGNAGKVLTDHPDRYRTLLIDKAKIPVPIKDTYKSPSFSKPQLPSEEDFNRVMTWMVEKNLLDKPFTYSDLIDNSLL